jgi:hypothetical protein
MNPDFTHSMFSIFSRRVLAPAIILCIATFGSAQANAIPDTNKPVIDRIAPKPYKVLTAGKRITVQCKTEISKIMVWTSSGHRFVEENDVKAPSYTFVVSISEKFFYIMLELKDGKRYTEKVGVQ